MKRSANMNQRRKGISLYEIVVSMGIFVIAMNLSAQMFRSLILTGADSGKLLNESAGVDAAIGKLRRDVWGASQINVSDSHTAQLGTSATWTILPDRVERTGSDGKTEQWAGIGKNWSFARDGAALTISDDTAPGSAQGATAVRLVSQVLLAGEMR